MVFQRALRVIKKRNASILSMNIMVCACLAGVLCLSLPVIAAAEGELKKVSVDDPVLDRNGDGFQDVIINRKSVHYDLDFDGRFDITLSLYLSEYNSKWHKSYIASNGSPEVFEEITMECLDELCASSRDEARWYEDNFREFTFYSGWYKRLYLFSESPLNDGRLAGKKHKGEYEYWITFNPDGTILTAKHGDKKVVLAKFDEETKTSSGEKMTLPKIESREDLDKVKSELAKLF